MRVCCTAQTTGLILVAITTADRPMDKWKAPKRGFNRLYKLFNYICFIDVQKCTVERYSTECCALSIDKQNVIISYNHSNCNLWYYI